MKTSSLVSRTGLAYFKIDTAQFTTGSVHCVVDEFDHLRSELDGFDLRSHLWCCSNNRNMVLGPKGLCLLMPGPCRTSGVLYSSTVEVLFRDHSITSTITSVSPQVPINLSFSSTRGDPS